MAERCIDQMVLLNNTPGSEAYRELNLKKMAKNFQKYNKVIQENMHFCQSCTGSQS